MSVVVITMPLFIRLNRHNRDSQMWVNISTIREILVVRDHTEIVYLDESMREVKESPEEIINKIREI